MHAAQKVDQVEHVLRIDRHPVPGIDGVGDVYLGDRQRFDLADLLLRFGYCSRTYRLYLGGVVHLQHRACRRRSRGTGERRHARRQEKGAEHGAIQIADLHEISVR